MSQSETAAETGRAATGATTLNSTVRDIGVEPVSSQFPVAAETGTAAICGATLNSTVHENRVEPNCEISRGD